MKTYRLIAKNTALDSLSEVALRESPSGDWVQLDPPPELFDDLIRSIRDLELINKALLVYPKGTKNQKEKTRPLFAIARKEHAEEILKWL